MISLEQKKKIVEDLKDRFERSAGVYLVDFQTMTVAEANAFRSKLTAEGIDYKVAKNTLISKAIEGNEKFPFLDSDLKGQSGLIFGYEDAVTAAKILKKSHDETEKPKLKAAILDGAYYDSTQLKTLASLPTKEDLIASIMGSLNAPASGIVGSIGAVIRDLAYLVEEVAKKNNDAA